MKTKKKPVLVASEHQEQKALIDWCKIQGSPLTRIYAVPNGGDRHHVVAAKLKAEGVRSSIPDLNLDYPCHGWHGARLEMKSRTGSARPDQKEELAWLYLQGYHVGIYKGWEMGREGLLLYLRHGRLHKKAFEPIKNYMIKHNLWRPDGEAQQNLL